MGVPKFKRPPPTPDFDAIKASTVYQARGGNLSAEGASDLFEQNLDGLYKQAEKMGVADPADSSVANFTPSYLLPQEAGQVVFAGATPSVTGISRATPLELSRKINGDEIAQANERLFLKNNSPNQPVPFPIIHPKGLRAHLDRPVYFLRGLADDIKFPDAYGMADTAQGLAVFDRSMEGTRRATDRHEALHVMNDRSLIAANGEDLVPSEMDMESMETLPSGYRRQISNFERLYGRALRDGVHPKIAEEAADESASIYTRMAEDQLGQEAKALMAEALGDMQQIHGPARTNADRMELYRMLLGEGHAPLNAQAPIYRYGPNRDQPAHHFNDVQRGIRALHDSMPTKDHRKTLRDIWLKLLSDNSETPEAPYV